MKRNNIIDIFRYIFAVNVALFHCQGLSDISPTLNYMFAQIPTRVAVPFFFTVGGYFFCTKLVCNDNKLISKYFKKELF